jgi:ribosomal protein S18 acetylase RimI-like enzyme
MKWFFLQKDKLPISDKVVIRHLHKSELKTLEWGGEYKHFRRLYADIFQNSNQGKAILWVAELPHVEIIGQMLVQLCSSRTELADGFSRAYIFGFRIKPPYRGKGVGTKMLLIVENDLRRRCFQNATLNVAQDNIKALKLYQRLGYKIVADDPGEWSYINHEGKRCDVKEPSWRMEKNLNNDH